MLVNKKQVVGGAVTAVVKLEYAGSFEGKL